MASFFRVEGKSSTPIPTETIPLAQHPSLVHHIPDLDAARAPSMRRRVERCWGPEDVSDTDFLRYCIENKQRILDLKKTTESEENKRDFLIAAEEGKTSVIKQMIDSGAVDVNDADKDGNTALIKAAANGHQEIVGMFLDKGADIEHPNAKGDTALMCAAKEGQLPVVDMLLSADAQSDHPNARGWTPLMGAIIGGHLNVIERLIDKGADVNRLTKDEYSTPLTIACDSRHSNRLTLLRMLLDKGADVNGEVYRLAGATSVLTAPSGNGDLEVVEMFLDAGANPNGRESSGYIPPLIAAAGNGRLDVVEKLLAKGADVNIKGRGMLGWTALIYAADGSHLPVMEMLIDKGADMDEEDHRKRTVLMNAAENGHLAMIEMLVAKGVDVNHKNRISKETALMYASERGHLPVVEVLLAAGAKDIREALEAAREYHQTEVALRLEEALSRASCLSSIGRLLCCS
ncbi:MAG: ankyrin repeat domain-containing protein [Simkaniaceae bacterium]|nr:ankyrin repeat domain-containing protein [Simkaniaceae bacterium]MCF7852989.1 ankyrin repeat domain-containing protein [Simkaniaceae bacterium]